MIILDTNILSALMTETPDPSVVSWLDRQARVSIWTTSITVLEILYGLATMAEGRRRKSRVAAFTSLLSGKLESRIAAFDQSAAESTALLMAQRTNRGNPGDLRDSMIAGIVLSRQAVLATRNVRHFADLGLDVINPWSL